MALGKRQDEKQKDLFVAAISIPKSPGHPFYKRLNELLKVAGFDEWTEKLCAPFYADGVGRRGIAPGVYFRMLLVGYFDGIDSQRGIAWRLRRQPLVAGVPWPAPDRDEPGALEPDPACGSACRSRCTRRCSRSW